MTVQLHILLTWPTALVATAALLLPFAASDAANLVHVMARGERRENKQQCVREY